MNDWYKPLESFCIGIGDGTNNFVCLEPEVRKLEANYIEAIEALKRIITSRLFEEQNDYCQTYEEAKNIHKKEINVIEKVTGQKWEDIK